MRFPPKVGSVLVPDLPSYLCGASLKLPCSIQVFEPAQLPYAKAETSRPPSQSQCNTDKGGAKASCCRYSAQASFLQNFAQWHGLLCPNTISAFLHAALQAQAGVGSTAMVLLQTSTGMSWGSGLTTWPRYLTCSPCAILLQVLTSATHFYDKQEQRPVQVSLMMAYFPACR